MNSSTVFISYSHNDKEWVKSWFLPRFENNGFQSHIDYRDFEIGVPSILNMERAVEKCAKTILILSQNWCESNWTQFEGLMLQTEDPMNLEKKIIPLMLSDCTLPKRLKMFTYADFRDQSEWESQLARLKAQIKKDLAGEKEEQLIYSPPDKVDILRLPQTGYELFGRQQELTQLNEAWESETINMIAFVAYGGTGKSTLVNKWLEKMRWDNYRGAKRVYAWSFYSQGTGEWVTSGDLFIKEALTWFGDKNPEAGSPWDKGKRLANLIRHDKTLLILDGLEPLQSYLDVEKGKIKDPALAVLVTELAKNNNGLCIITTREEIPDIRRFPSSARQVNLEQISEEAGRALLRVRGIRGTDAELEGVTRAFGNHALAINLLAEYLHLIPGHPAEKASDIPDLDIPEEQDKHPRRVIEAFAAHFGQDTELELLHILGLFDRPADKTAIDAVIKGKPIPGLTERLHQISEGEWFKLLQKLRDMKLIAPESHHRSDTIVCHPLIREHFSQELRAKRKTAWKEANSRLYEHFKSLPDKELPDTLEEMEPLFMAVVHGCRADNHHEILCDVYWERIRRKEDNYICNKIGAFGSDLTAISNFFEKPWSKVTGKLKEEDKAVILSWAGFRLRALGRLREAVQPMEASLKIGIEQENWKLLAIRAGNLSELYLTLGDVAQAVAFGRQSVEFADKSGDEFRRWSDRGRLALALHQKNELFESKDVFKEAENICKSHHGLSYLYSEIGFYFCDLLINQGLVEEVLKRAKWLIEYDRKRSTASLLLDYAFDQLSLGRAYLLQAVQKMDSTSKVESIFQQAVDYLNQAVDGLRLSGNQDEVPRGLFARAELYRLQGDYSCAWDDLEEAHDIAERGEMRLWLTGYHLAASRLLISEFGFWNGDYQHAPHTTVETFHDVETFHEMSLQETSPHETSLQKADDHLKQAAELVNETGYHRRDPELLLLQAQFHFANGDRENAQIWLNKAKDKFDEMGIRMWDWEVRELEQAIG